MKDRDEGTVSSGTACIPCCLSKGMRVSCGQRDTEENSWAWSHLAGSPSRRPPAGQKLGRLKEMT